MKCTGTFWKDKKWRKIAIEHTYFHAGNLCSNCSYWKWCSDCKKWHCSVALEVGDYCNFKKNSRMLRLATATKPDLKSDQSPT